MLPFFKNFLLKHVTKVKNQQCCNSIHLNLIAFKNICYSRSNLIKDIDTTGKKFVVHLALPNFKNKKYF